jgi:NAD-dependent protein deacetylase/lipoamidase
MTLELRERLRSVRSVGAITGAGVSAESGIRTYRGAGGIYEDPAEGERTVEALSGRTLAIDPDRTWRALAQLARQAHGAKPGPAHYALAAIEHRVERFVLLTQNVDGLHQAAGSRNVIDIHGSLESTFCPRCLMRRPLGVGQLARLERAPRCPACEAPLRPDAVLFGERLPLDKVARIANELERDPPDLVLVAGTSALFPYIGGPVEAAARRGRITIEINPEPTELSAIVELTLRGGAGHWLPRISRDLPRTAPVVERPRDRLGRPLPAGRASALGPLEVDTVEDAVALFVAERCFEAHEAFERLWHAEAIESDRVFFRGLAQLAVAGCHAQRGNPAGAETLLARARAALARYPEGHRGIHRAELEAAVDRLRDQVVDDTL